MREVIKKMRIDTGLRSGLVDSDILASLLVFKEVSKAYLQVSQGSSWEATSFRSERHTVESFVYASTKIYPVTPETLEVYMQQTLSSGLTRASFIEEVVGMM